MTSLLCWSETLVTHAAHFFIHPIVIIFVFEKSPSFVRLKCLKEEGGGASLKEFYCNLNLESFNQSLKLHRLFSDRFPMFTRRQTATQTQKDKIKGKVGEGNSLNECNVFYMIRSWAVFTFRKAWPAMCTENVKSKSRKALFTLTKSECECDACDNANNSLNAKECLHVAFFSPFLITRFFLNNAAFFN